MQSRLQSLFSEQRRPNIWDQLIESIKRREGNVSSGSLGPLCCTNTRHSVPAQGGKGIGNHSSYLWEHGGNSRERVCVCVVSVRIQIKAFPPTDVTLRIYRADPELPGFCLITPPLIGSLIAGEGCGDCFLLLRKSDESRVPSVSLNVSWRSDQSMQARDCQKSSELQHGEIRSKCSVFG